MSISSAVVSFISFFQNLSVNISLPHINFPSWLISFLNGINNFVAKIQSFISAIPPFDMRTQLVIMSVGIPLVLDILFVWFVQPFLTTFFNVFDIAITVLLFAFCGIGFIDQWTVTLYIFTPILGIVLIIRLIYQVNKKNGQDFEMIKLARRICNHFLYGMIPNLKHDYSIDHLNNAILKFSAIVEIKPSPPKLYITINFLIAAILLFLISLFFFGCYPFLQSKLADQINTALGSVFIVFSVIFLIVFILRLFKFGRKFILLFKQFCKHWGLRLMMLCFDVLYIPIVSLFANHVNVKKYVACPVGEYLYQIPDKYHNTMSLLVTHNVTCIPCNISNQSVEWPVDCYSYCNGEARWRSIDDPSLDFINDIVQFSSGFLLYCACFVMIGIPCLWYYVIKRNKNFALVVNVYGRSPQEKWLKLVNRMKTTGIFLFWNYKHNISIWAVLYLLVKFLVMIFSLIASRFVKYLNVMMPVVYISVFALILAFRPYIYFVNNLLDLILYFTQFLFSLNSILAVYNAEIPKAVCTLFSVIVIVVPVVSIVFVIFFRKRHANFDTDPTFPQKLEPEEEEELEQKRRMAKRKHDKKLRKQKLKIDNEETSKHESSINEEIKSENDIENNDYKELVDKNNENNRADNNINNNSDNNNINNSDNKNINDFNEHMSGDDINQPLLDRNSDDNDGSDLSIEEFNEIDEFIELEEFDENENICYIPEDEYEVQPGDLDSVERALKKLNKVNQKVTPEDGGKTYIVNKRVLANRMSQMYKMLDIVVDGSTIDLLTSVLNLAIIMGTGAFGWFVGTVIANDGFSRKPVCHFL